MRVTEQSVTKMGFYCNLSSDDYPATVVETSLGAGKSAMDSGSGKGNDFSGAKSENSSSFWVMMQTRRFHILIEDKVIQYDSVKISTEDT